MKKTIIFGSCLVAGAVIYGFVDYAHTGKKKLQQMYMNTPAELPEPPPPPPANQVSKEVDTALAAPADTTVLQKKSLGERPPKNLNLALYSRSIPGNRLRPKNRVPAQPPADSTGVEK